MRLVIARSVSAEPIHLTRPPTAGLPRRLRLLAMTMLVPPAVPDDGLPSLRRIVLDPRMGLEKPQVQVDAAKVD